MSRFVSIPLAVEGRLTHPVHRHSTGSSVCDDHESFWTLCAFLWDVLPCARRTLSIFMHNMLALINGLLWCMLVHILGLFVALVSCIPFYAAVVGYVGGGCRVASVLSCMTLVAGKFKSWSDRSRVLIADALHCAAEVLVLKRTAKLSLQGCGQYCLRLAVLCCIAAVKDSVEFVEPGRVQ